MSSERGVGLLAGLAIAGALAGLGYKAGTGIEAAHAAQAKALDNLRVWKAAYQALEPVNGQWQSAFGLSAASGEQDLVSIGQSLRLSDAGLSFDINALRTDRMEPVMFEGAAIGLNRVCVSGGSPSGNGLGVSAPTMSELISGISKLSRKDIEMDSIDISLVEGVPRATLGGLCVLVRSEENNG